MACSAGKPLTNQAARSVTIWLAFCVGGLLAAIWSGEAVGQVAVPVDVYGRPLADQLGPIWYGQDGENWIALHADGSWEPMPPATIDPTVLPSANLPRTGFHFEPYLTMASGSKPTATAIGDVTGDGRPDVVMTTGFFFDPPNDNKLLVYPQTAGGTLASPLRYSYEAHADRNGLVLADLDENGVLDVVVGHATGITVLLSDAQGGLRPGVVTADADADDLAAMDVDRDGHVDVVSLGGTRGATIFLGDGHGGFRQTQQLDTYARGFNEVERADMTGDGFDDLAIMSGSWGAYVSIHRHDGIGGFVPGFERYGRPDFLFGGLGLGDVSGDGLNDAVLARVSNTPTWLSIMTQSASDHRLMDPMTVPTFHLPASVEVTDVDGDGREDVVVLHGAWIRLGVYLQTPSGGLSPEVLYPIPFVSYSAGSSMAIGDFSSDGCVDIAFGTYPLGLVILHGRGCVPRCQPDLCDDDNPCTDDACNPATGCVFTNNAAACDDGNACTTGDVCGGGVCSPGGPANCDDGICCTIDSCIPATGCIHTANTAAPVFTTQPSLGVCPVLWPPEHGYADFTLADTAAVATPVEGGCPVADVQFASCLSSQAENGPGTGDGNTIRDCVYEPEAVHVRAERDGACGPTGRVYVTRLVAIDVCGNSTISDALEIGVWHHRGQPPVSATIYHAAPGSGTVDTRDGTNGMYGGGCGSGTACAIGAGVDRSDSDPEMEIAQRAAISVDDLSVRMVSGAHVILTWTEPVHASGVDVTKFHVYRQDPVIGNGELGAELPPHTLAFQDPIVNDAVNVWYKVTAVIK